jgi:hypothetical protein
VLCVAEGLEEVELGEVISGLCGLAGCALEGLVGAWLLEDGVWSELCGCAAVGF